MNLTSPFQHVSVSHRDTIHCTHSFFVLSACLPACLPAVDFLFVFFKERKKKTVKIELFSCDTTCEYTVSKISDLEYDGACAM